MSAPVVRNGPAALDKDRVIAIVVPGSSTVKRQAESEGLAKIFLEAGFQWRESGCSMCVEASIRAVSMPDAIAQKPGAPCRRGPALEVTRYYLDITRRTITLSVNIYPADRYTHSIEVERQS